MNAKDWFSVAVRVVGLVACLRGGEDFIYVFMANLGYTSSGSVTASSPLHVITLVIGLFYFSAGLYLLRGASLLLDYAFPNKEIEQEIPDNTDNIENQ